MTKMMAVIEVAEGTNTTNRGANMYLDKLSNLVIDRCADAWTKIQASEGYQSLEAQIDKASRAIDRKAYIELDNLIAEERCIIEQEMYLQGLQDGMALRDLLGGEHTLNELRQQQQQETAATR